MSADWFFDNLTKVYSIVKKNTETSLKAIYPNIYYTTELKTSTTTKLPTILFEELSPSEMGTTLKGDCVAGVMCTIQITVTVNTKPTEARKVARVLFKAMKELGFEGTSPITITNADDTYSLVSRYRRAIGEGDSL